MNMSWTVEEWKTGLPCRALQKIQEYETQLEKTQKEKQQKQFQLESLESAFHKQKQKFEEAKAEVSCLKRETQSLSETCDGLEKTRQRLLHEVQVKERQVDCLEGQLVPAKKRIESLEQEIKRYQAEVEKLQSAQQAGDSQLFSTPSWSFSGFTTPVKESNDSRWENHGRYPSVSEEEKRPGGEKALHVKQQLMFSGGEGGGPEIPHRSHSPLLPHRQDLTPIQRRSSSFETQVKRASPAGLFPWQQDDLPAPHVTRSTPVSTKLEKRSVKKVDGWVEENGNVPHAEEQLRKENEVLRHTVSELEVWIQSQESETKTHMRKWQELQSQLEAARGELSGREQNLSKCEEELSRRAAQHQKVAEKCTALEQRAKQLSEELNCQRQNAETARHHMEQKMKEKEKECQQEMAQQQRLVQSLEQQHRQESTKLHQEAEQTKNDYLAVQAKLDKLTAQKQNVDKELGDVKGKLLWAEKEILSQHHQDEELQKKLKAAMKEKDNLSVCMNQSNRRVSQLEDELKKTAQDLGVTKKEAEELKTKYLALTTEINVQEISPKKTSFTNEPNPKKAMDCHSKTQSCDQENRVINENKIGRLEEAEESLLLSEVTNGKLSEEMPCEGIVHPEQMDQTFPVGPKNEFKGAGGELEMIFHGPLEGVQKPFREMQPSPGLQKIKEDNSGKESKSLKAELEDLKQQLSGSLIESETHQKALAEVRWKLRQVSKKHGGESGRLKKQIEELKEKCANLETELEWEKSLALKLQEAIRGTERECTNLSDQVTSKEDLVQQKENEIQTLKENLREFQQKLLDQTREIIHCQELTEIKNTKDIESEMQPDLGYNKVTDLEETGGVIEVKCKIFKELAKSKETLVEKKNEITFVAKRMQDLKEEFTVQEEQLGPGQEFGCKCNKITIEKPSSKEFKDRGVQVYNGNSSMEFQNAIEDLQKQCEILSIEKGQAEEKAKEAESKLATLQGRINLQTQQLTIAFETQSQNIENLLLNIEEKDNVIENTNEKLQSTLEKITHLQMENQELTSKLSLALKEGNIETVEEKPLTAFAGVTLEDENAVLTETNLEQECKSETLQLNSNPENANNKELAIKMTATIEKDQRDSRHAPESTLNRECFKPQVVEKEAAKPKILTTKLESTNEMEEQRGSSEASKEQPGSYDSEARQEKTLENRCELQTHPIKQQHVNDKGNIEVVERASSESSMLNQKVNQEKAFSNRESEDHLPQMNKTSGHLQGVAEQSKKGSELLQWELNSLIQKCSSLQEGVDLNPRLLRLGVSAEKLQHENQTLKMELEEREKQSDALRRELEEMKGWKQKVSEELALLVADRDHWEVERSSLTRSLHEVSSKTLEVECRALKDSWEGLRDSGEKFEESDLSSPCRLALQSRLVEMEEMVAQLMEEKGRFHRELEMWKMRHSCHEEAADHCKALEPHEKSEPTPINDLRNTAEELSEAPESSNPVEAELVDTTGKEFREQQLSEIPASMLTAGELSEAPENSNLIEAELVDSGGKETREQQLSETPTHMAKELSEGPESNILTEAELVDSGGEETEVQRLSEIPAPIHTAREFSGSSNPVEAELVDTVGKETGGGQQLSEIPALTHTAGELSEGPESSSPVEADLLDDEEKEIGDQQLCKIPALTHTAGELSEGPESSSPVEADLLDDEEKEIGDQQLPEIPALTHTAGELSEGPESSQDAQRDGAVTSLGIAHTNEVLKAMDLVTLSQLETEIEFLKKELQTKTSEADSSSEKYSVLLGKCQALEETNRALSETVATLSQELTEVKASGVGAEVGKEVLSRQTQTDEGKTPGAAEGSKSLAWQWKEDPAKTAARILKKRNPVSVAYDDTEYEPYGLPEVVMKGGISLLLTSPKGCCHPSTQWKNGTL
nr:PREDICTED: centromere protein F-like [Latimeria chalumnae]|eukprot:XP_014354160.1 PREDICTED: centromere protein F-like [Latimeria chalumnae]